MARPREFDDDTALLAAIKVFSDLGFEGSSTDALTRAMGIGRQSLYDTFGDKWRLYLKALQRYTADSISEQIRVLNGGPSALKGLEAHIYGAVNNALADLFRHQRDLRVRTIKSRTGHDLRNRQSYIALCS